MKRRKHRLYVDITVSEAMSKRRAAKALRLMLDRIDLQAQPIWAHEKSPYCDKLVVVEPRS